jgi:hypothetical protein
MERVYRHGGRTSTAAPEHPGTAQLAGFTTDVLLPAQERSEGIGDGIGPEQWGSMYPEAVTWLSHELRTPLASVFGYLELLDMQGELNASQRATCEVIRRNALRLTVLADRLTELANDNDRQHRAAS